jgi:spermidine/putrescine transport system permease protein
MSHARSTIRSGRLLAAPASVWLAFFLGGALYALVSVALGDTDPILLRPRPQWNPLEWSTRSLNLVFDRFSGDEPIYRSASVRTAIYVLVAVTASLAIAYPVAWFVARHAGRARNALLIAIAAPLLVSYMMRMLGWINLLSTDGYVNQLLQRLGVINEPYGFLDGHSWVVVLGLIYGNIPFLMLALVPSLERIGDDQLDAAKDLGAHPSAAFRQIAFPQTKAGIAAGCLLIGLPMVGDYFTAQLLAGGGRTSMIGSQVALGLKGPRGNVGAALVLVMTVALLAVLVTGLRSTRGQDAITGLGPARSQQPGRHHWGLIAITGTYLFWSLLPIIVSMRLAFNDGRSRTQAQGLSLRWFTGDPTQSVWHDPALRTALSNSLRIGVIVVAIAVPLGAAAAIGLQRWRHGPLAKTAVALTSLVLVVPELVLGASLFLVFVHGLTSIGLGITAMVIGHVTISLGYVVLIVTARAATLDSDLDDAASDLGAAPTAVLRSITVPLLAPAIGVAALVTFVLSLDDFVVSSFLATDASTITVPMRLYASGRSAPSPALNALGAVQFVLSATVVVASIMLWRLGARWRRRNNRPARRHVLSGCARGRRIDAISVHAPLSIDVGIVD